MSTGIVTQKSIALLVVDMQDANGQLSTSGWDQARYDEVARACEGLAGSGMFPYVISTSFRNDDGSAFQELLHWDGLSDPGTWAVNERIARLSDVIFTDCTYFPVTKQMVAWMSEHEIGSVVICGIETDCCVMHAAAQTFELGMPTAVAEYACMSSHGTDWHEPALSMIGSRIGYDNVLHDIEQVHRWRNRQGLID